MNRTDAHKATLEAAAPTTAIISVTDTGSEKNRFYPQPWLKGVVELQFLDVEAGGYDCITRTQAKIIADFARRMHKQVERFIVHCEFGQSRSAGIAAALIKYFEGHDGGIFMNKRYNPNRTCYRYVLKELQKNWFFRLFSRQSLKK